MPVIAVIEVAFDPSLQVGDLVVRWQTVGVTLALIVAFSVAAVRARYLPPPGAAAPAPLVTRRPVQRRFVGVAYPPAPEVVQPVPARTLRLDDLVFIVLGTVPGAVIGGRLAHALTFWEAYAAQSERLLDPVFGSLSLTGAVLGGALSGTYICRLLGAPVVRWADAAAAPLLLATGLGKVAQFLGGSGQGAPSDGPLAIAFGGAGPWVTANAAVPAHPSQLYESVWLLAGLGIVALVRAAGPVILPALHVPGSRLLLAIAWFLIGRVVVGFTWRDDRVIGPLNAEQFLAVVLLVLVVGVAVWRFRRSRYRGDVYENDIESSFARSER